LSDISKNQNHLQATAPDWPGDCIVLVMMETIPHALRAGMLSVWLLAGLAGPVGAAIAVAAPVTSATVELTNAEWTISKTRISRRTKIAQVHLVNDFEALAWGLDALGPKGRRKLGRGKADPRWPRAVFGPGTGLGVAAFVPPAAGGPAAIAAAGGHATLAAGTMREAEVIGILRARFGHVSAERLLSGPGLANIYTVLSALDLHSAEDPPHPGEIACAAREGSDEIARETVQMFSALLGQYGGDVALMYGARGGVFIGGGVVARLGTAFDKRLFRTRFEAKGRYKTWLGTVPTYLITHPQPAMPGLARFLDHARTV